MSAITASRTKNTGATEAHHAALSKAKIQLMATPNSVFFTTLCFSLKHVWDDRVRTASTDGKDIRYNPEFFLSLTTKEQVFLLLHETMHVAYLHALRLNGRDHRRWNYACDYVINLQLVERGFAMPAHGLLDTQYAGMSAEEVYKLLPENPSQDCDTDLEEPGSDSEESEADRQERIDTLSRDIEDMLVRASIQSKMSGDKPGTIPGDIQLILDGLLNPKLPWNRLLQKYFTAFDKNDYSFRKPNRRFFPRYHLPGLTGEKLMDLAVAVDTSGSVSDHDFQTFISEVASLLRMSKPERITFLQFDTEIKQVNEIKNLKELLGLGFTGRGGTVIAPVLEWARQQKPQLLLIFSDGEFRLPNQEDMPKHTQVIWLIHNNSQWTIPFGKVIHYTI